VLAIGFRVSLSVVVVRSWLSGVVYRVLVVDCRLSTCSIVGAQLWELYTESKTVSAMFGHFRQHYYIYPRSAWKGYCTFVQVHTHEIECVNGRLA
jgi:hypothetical protein